MQALRIGMCGLVKRQLTLRPLALNVTPLTRRVSSSNPKSSPLEDQESEQEDFSMTNDMLCNRYKNLFYMPDLVGPAYQGFPTISSRFYTQTKPVPSTLVESQIVSCPELMVPYLKSLFVNCFYEIVDAKNLSIINLGFGSDVNVAIKEFVQLGAHYCVHALTKGYWADFVNPFTGRAFFHSVAQRHLNTDAGFVAHNMNFSQLAGCTVIRETTKRKFTGAIFTDAPRDFMETYWEI